MIFKSTLFGLLVYSIHLTRLQLLTPCHVFLDTVRPLPLTWTAIKAGDKFNISWIPPDFCELSCWMFKIRQTACNKSLVGDTNVQYLDLWI